MRILKDAAREGERKARVPYHNLDSVLVGHYPNRISSLVCDELLKSTFGLSWITFIRRKLPNSHHCEIRSDKWYQLVLFCVW